MTTLQLDLAIHRNQQVILLRFTYRKDWVERVRKLPNNRWSKTFKCWYIPYEESAITLIYQTFENTKDIQIEISEALQPLSTNLAASRLINDEEVETAIDRTEEIARFTKWMRSRRYSESTIKTYAQAMRVFLRFCKSKTIEEIENEDIIEFNNRYIVANQYSSSLQNQVVNAIKLFFRVIENTRLEIDLIHRPKRAKLLPNVLSKEEVKLLLGGIINLKHRMMLSLIYACGLRCGELLHLMPIHIDSNRMILLVKQGKGRKDRIVPLSQKIIEMLREYYKLYRPKVYLFEGMTAGAPYDERSLQQVMKQSVQRVGIEKPVTLHWLRHSYATHLLESGTDLRYIQEILGHNSSRTTEIYTHVSTQSIRKIISPFDTL